MGVFTMPSLGSDMESGTLVEWLVKPGDRVKRGDVVAVVETQKGAIEIECFEDGVVERLEASLGAKLPVGAPLAVITGAGEAAPAKPAATQPAPEPQVKAPAPAPEPEAAAPTPAPAAEPKAAAPEPTITAPPLAAPAPAPAPAPPAPRPVPQPAMAAPVLGAQPEASPAARAEARRLGIDLAVVAGSGPDGVILLRDLGAAPAPAPVKAAKPGLDLDAMRAAIAAAMTRSKHEIPHYYLSKTVDLQPATDWLAARNADRPPEERLLMGALFVKAAALAARKVAKMAGQYENGTFRPAEAIHTGVAVALRGGGLIAPAIMAADALDLDALMAAMRDLVTRARSGRLKNSEMTKGQITVSSMGETGAESLTGVIYPPQVALVGFGAPVTRPWVVGETVVPRQVVTVTLAADHRVSDGRQGARYLDAVETLLSTPEEL